jgi:Transposase IS4
LKKTLVQQRVYENRNEKGLFHLFLNQSCLEGIRVWTNAELLRKGKKKVSKEMFNAYIGLDLAMSIVHLNDMHDYWSTKMFLGNDDMKRIMSQDRFTEIRSSLKFYPEYDHAVAVVDPPWHSRIMLHHFMKNAASVAVPKGCSALDENTIRCKVRTGARSYMKSKTVKFGIWFYAVVGWKHAYVHSLWDNGSGNKRNVPPAHLLIN